MNGLVLSISQFKTSIKDNYESMGLEEIFNIDKKKIKQTWNMWEERESKKVYAKYLAMLMGLPNHITYVDTDLLLFKIARNIAHELVIRLAEGFYYDDKLSVIGENTVPNHFSKQKTDEVSPYQLAYFLELCDAIYNRDELGKDTLTLLRDTFREPNYLIDIWAREKEK